jgi:hypothetical protein
MLNRLPRKKNNLNLVPGDPYLVLIVLNPTEEAHENNPVFSRDEGFWNLLRDAGFVYDVSEVPLSKRATEVFCEQKHSPKKTGFADLLLFVYDKDSAQVNAVWKRFSKKK